MFTYRCKNCGYTTNYRPSGNCQGCGVRILGIETLFGNKTDEEPTVIDFITSIIVQLTIIAYSVAAIFFSNKISWGNPSDYVKFITVFLSIIIIITLIYFFITVYKIFKEIAGNFGWYF